jgi:ATP-dependent DNA helicase RecG
MATPSWADASISAALPGLREKGECQDLEFKEDLPKQLHELGRDMAALASSGGGKILIGVCDKGTLVGIPYADAAERDEMWRRVHGVLNGVKPAFSAKLVFGVEADKTVLVVDIPKQQEPVFYYDHRPYVRDGSVSRPATPDEVKELIWSHPSSEHKRFVEQANRQWITMIQEDSRRHAETSDELHRAANRRLLGQ